MINLYEGCRTVKLQRKKVEEQLAGAGGKEEWEFSVYGGKVSV